MASMNINHFDISKTGMLFFDLLNSFIHGGDEDAKARKMPMVKNAVRLMRASRAAAMPIFFAKANHRSDGFTASNLITDTDTKLKPWHNGMVAWRKPNAVEGDWGSEVIPELEPSAERLLYSQVPLQRVLPDLSGSRAPCSRHRYPDYLGRINGRRRVRHSICRQRPRLSFDRRSRCLCHRP